MTKVRPSELELQVLGVLWDRGPSPVRAVLEAMPDGKDRAYTTILSVMQVMEKKGLVGHTQQGHAHIYHARVRRDEVLGPLMKDLLRNAFGGSPARALQYLLGEAELRDGELDEIRRMIEEAGGKPDLGASSGEGREA
jgi:BlaI family transcriptional regulator, penicillinase repressor